MILEDKAIPSKEKKPKTLSDHLSEENHKRLIDLDLGDKLNDIKFENSSQFHLAKVLNSENRPWRYKSICLLLSNENSSQDYFIPQFYLPREGRFIHISSLEYSLTDLDKANRFRELNPCIDIELLEQDDADESYQKLKEKLREESYDTIERVISRGGFAHESEENVANLFNFYNIKWLYEARTYPLKWNKNRRTTSAFTPDFYLPHQDMHVELTTMKQKLVTKKNKKVRKFRRIYPKERIIVWYENDYKDLILELNRFKD